MKNLTYRIGQWPLGTAIEMLLILFIAVLLLTLSGCATPTGKAEEPLTVHDANAARAMALQKIGESGDPETKRLAIFALVTMGQGGQAAAPVGMQQGPRTFTDTIFQFLDRALVVAPSWFAYKSQIRSAQTTETVAAINRDVSLNQSNNFLALGAAGIGGTASVGTAGVNALATVASRPVPPSTVNTITGNAGPVNLGGTLTYAPITSSQNPVTTNPARVCTVTALGVQTCSGP